MLNEERIVKNVIFKIVANISARIILFFFGILVSLVGLFAPNACMDGLDAIGKERV
jgi:hypothetical protein